MPVNTGSFQGYPFPADVQARIIALLITGSAFADGCLTRQPTDRSTVAWPTAKPTGFAWLDELQPFPVVGMDDDAYVVAVAKIGGIVDLSNEAAGDSSFNMTASLTAVLRDSLSRDLDLGILNGAGPPEPVGVVGVAPPVNGADLLAAVATARGQIADAGGSPSTIALSGTLLADADTERDVNGQLIYPAGFAAAAGLTAVVVPGLPTPLVMDKSRCFLAVRNDAVVEASRDWHFDRDALSLRIKARVTAAIPDVPRSIRKLVVAPPLGAEPELHGSQAGKRGK